MTKKELKQLFYLRKEIKMWEYEIYKLRQESEIKGQDLSGLPPAAVGGGKVENKVIKILEKEEIYEELKEKAEILEKEILEYIRSIDDSMIRLIINYRYIRFFSWYRIARYIGGNNTADGVRKIHDRFLEKQEKENVSVLSDEDVI